LGGTIMALTGLVAANNLSDVVDIERTWDNIGSNISATVFVPAATLDLNFAANKSLVDNISGSGLVTFTRASSGTFVGSNGLIQNAASGVPRFDHDPVTGESLGLLMEETRTNLILYSESAAGRSWVYGQTPLDNALSSPNGTVTAIKVRSTSGTSLAFVEYSATISASSTYTFSIFAKAGEWRRIGIRGFYDGTSYRVPHTTIDLISKQVISSTITPIISDCGNGWIRISITFTTAATPSPLSGGIPVECHNVATTQETEIGDGASGIYIWGAQLEAGNGVTSYIPTTSATVTRAADIASITGTNFSRWYQQTGGTILINSEKQPSNVFYVGMSNINYTSALMPIRVYNTLLLVAADYNTVNVYRSLNDTPRLKWAISFSPTSVRESANGNTIISASAAITTSFDRLSFAGLPWETGAGGGPAYGSVRFSRFTYYPAQLSDITLQALSASGAVSSFPYSFSIKGRDILALKEVNKTSTRDFVFIKGLLSKVQPRINTASQYTASGVALRNAAMLKVAPTTIGNYFFSSGLTLSGTTVQINGTNARSIATSPFSGSTALYPLLFGGLRPQANWRITEPMTSGTVTSPESAIPIETSDFLLFIKAGQS
jgi:hypothetical protein